MFTQAARRMAGGSVAVTAVLAVAVGAGAPATATAAGECGVHVSSCVHTMGFGADHNPGMHQGFHGWDPTHTC